MELSLESSWEFFEYTVLKRDKDHNLTNYATVYLYDDDRDIHLTIKGNSSETTNTMIDVLGKSLRITPFSFEGQESDRLYFEIGGNPPQAELRAAMYSSISQLESLGFKLRKLEDTWT